MQETGNNIIQQKRITLRITKTNLSFAAVDNTVPEGLRYEPYIVRSGISMPANLREAFISDNMLNADYKRAQVLIDSKVLMVPIEEFSEENTQKIILPVIFHFGYVIQFGACFPISFLCLFPSS